MRQRYRAGTNARSRARKRFAAIGAMWGLMCLCGGARVSAQEVPDAARAQAVLYASLDSALHGLAENGETALAVGANRVSLPTGAAKPPVGARVAQIATAYGYAARRYSGVTAVAPPTMTLLHSNLGPPNIYLNIPAREAFTLLAANLSDAQRQMLTGERGIGLSDMTSDLQRGLFLALLPGSSLPYHARPNADQTFTPGGAGRSVENPLQNGRIRVGMKQNMVVHSPGRDTMGNVQTMRDPKDPPIYDVANQDHLFRQETVDGVTVRSVVANTLKSTQLNYSLPALQTPVSLQDVKTVGELVARIAQQTRLELYADRHYESRPLTVVGANRTALAGDVLRVLAVCVTGAFRRVGPAYVLTDDLTGVGTRRTRIADLQADADAQRQKPLVEAEDKLQQTQAFWKHPPGSFGDSMAPTPEQMAHKEENILGGGAFRVIELNFDQLTPGQQNALKHYSEYYMQASADHSYQGIDFERPMQMFVVPSVQLLVPGVDGPIDTDLGQWVADVFHDMSRWKLRYRKPEPKPEANKGAEEAVPPMSGLVETIPHRALLADCRTVADVDNTVAKMKRMGLNELWLVAFTKGIARVKGTSFPTLAPDAPDLLTRALQITQGTGISVYPVVDVFQWGATMPAGQVDLTILGETSFQHAQRVHKRDVLNAVANGNNPPGEPSPRLTASVFAPEVLARLNGLVSVLTQRPGVAGVVWRETDPEGYAELDTPQAMRPAGTGQLGYTEAARLAFLRLHHADPIDVEPPMNGRGLEQRADTSLPLFDDWELDRKVSQEWNRFRAQANLQGLSALYAAVTSQNGPANGAANQSGQNTARQTQAVRLAGDGGGGQDAKPLVFVRERRAAYGTTWYGLWNGLDTALPTHHYDYEEPAANGDFKRAPEEFQQARSQGRLNLVRLPFWGGLDENALVKRWQNAFKDVAQNQKWDGFVLELMEP